MNKHDLTGFELYRQAEAEYEKDDFSMIGGVAFVFVFLMVVPYVLFMGA